MSWQHSRRAEAEDARRDVSGGCPPIFEGKVDVLAAGDPANDDTQGKCASGQWRSVAIDIPMTHSPIVVRAGWRMRSSTLLVLLLLRLPVLPSQSPLRLTPNNPRIWNWRPLPRSSPKMRASLALWRCRADRRLCDEEATVEGGRGREWSARGYAGWARRGAAAPASRPVTTQAPPVRA